MTDSITQQLYTVIFEDPMAPGWQFFRCQAENGDHAEEQCHNAEPRGVVLWVNLGDSQTMES